MELLQLPYQLLIAIPSFLWSHGAAVPAPVVAQLVCRRKDRSQLSTADCLTKFRQKIAKQGAAILLREAPRLVAKIFENQLPGSEGGSRQTYFLTLHGRS